MLQKCLIPNKRKTEIALAQCIKLIKEWKIIAFCICYLINLDLVDFLTFPLVTLIIN